MNSNSEILPIDQTIQEQNDELQNLKNVLELNIFGDKKVSDLIKDSLETTDEIEKEARELFNEVKTTFLKPKDGKKLGLEDAVMLGPVAQDYLKLMSDQVDNRTKLLKTISDLVKSAAPNTQFNQQFNNIPSEQEMSLPSPTIQKEIINASPFENREVKAEKKIKNDEGELVDAKQIKTLPMIHSYKHK